jgi:hypothetical protein
MKELGALIFFLSALNQGQFPFEQGEHLVYEVSYFGITAGYITLDYSGEREVNGKIIMEFVGTAETSKFFSTFFRVKDVIHLYMDKNMFRPIRVELNLREGKKKRTEEIVYDFEKMECNYYRKGKIYTTPIPENVQDSFASLYYYRMLVPNGDNDGNNAVSFNVYGSKKVWTLEAGIINREVLKTPVGEFKSFVIKPQTKFEGVLQAKGDVYMWFSDDDKRLPLKFEAQIKLGTLQGILVEYKLKDGGEKITSLD